jgi:hypothetical protein
MPVPGVSISVTIDTLVEELRPTIEQHRDEADRLGRLPDQVVAELREAGAFRLHRPRELGGAELSLRATLELLEGVGRIDGATAGRQPSIVDGQPELRLDRMPYRVGPLSLVLPGGAAALAGVAQAAVDEVIARPGLPTGEPFVCWSRTPRGL